MRFNKLFMVGSALALVVGATACDEGLTEINQNPNEPERINPQYLLADAQFEAVGASMGTHGVWFGLYLTDIWPQHLAQIQYNSEDRYILRPTVTEGFWNHQYSGPLADLAAFQRLGTEEKDVNQVAVGTIFSQYIFQVLTDAYGPIPYSEALGGLEGKTSPKYDSQEQVYNGMLAALTAAGQQLQPGARVDFAQGDLIYRGDMARWRKFANSLRMRMAMRMSDVAAAKARSEFVAAINAGGFTSNADNARLVYGNSINSQNPHYNYIFNQNRNDFVISETIVDTLKSFSDPRLQIYANPATSDNQYRGLRNGLYPSQYRPARILADFSKIGTAFVSPESPSVLMSYAEVLFLQAEAAAKGWINANAGDLYRQAITASLQQHGVAAASIATYLAQPRVAYNPATGLQQIWLQKWIALYMNGPEAYAEVRRTDTPTLKLADRAAQTAFPKRVSYPGPEQRLNAANYKAALGTLGGSDALATRLWWDVR